MAYVKPGWCRRRLPSISLSLSLSVFSMLIQKRMKARNTPKGSHERGHGMVNKMVHLFVPDCCYIQIPQSSKEKHSSQQALHCCYKFWNIYFLQNAAQSLHWKSLIYVYCINCYIKPNTYTTTLETSSFTTAQWFAGVLVTFEHSWQFSAVFFRNVITAR